MKAPISKKVLEILSDSGNAQTLIRSVVKKDFKDGSTIKIGDHEFELKRIASHSRY